MHIEFLFIIKCIFVFISGGQTITICSNPVKNDSCSITCSTPDFTQDIMFFRGSALQGGCVDIKGLSYCSAGMSQTGTNTTFTIPSLSKSADEGDWRCKYGTLSSIAETLTVYSMNYIFSSVQPNI